MSDPSAFRAVLGEDGRFVIPAPVRRELGLRPGDALFVESDGTSLLVRPYLSVVRETQAYFRQFAAPGASEADALIADRRAEAAREDPAGGPA